MKKQLTLEEKKEAKRIYDKAYQAANKEKRRKYLEDNRDRININKKAYYEANKDKIINKIKTYQKDNLDKINQYQKERLKTDVLFKLKTNIRNLIGNSLRKNKFKKLSKTEQILGCSYEEFKVHLESRFEEWMTWDNRGLYNGTPNYGWDIDHIIPLDTATNEIELIQLNHHTNLQPLCSYINRDVKRHNV
jgi:hypothetical protein